MSNLSVSDYIQKRQSVFPPLYIDKKIPKSIIVEILENANRAPTHKLTEPWRFKVLQGAIKNKLGTFLSEKYKTHITPDKFSQRKYDKLQANVKRSDTVIAIIMQRDLQERLPEWEEIASTAMAVQNMWLTAAAHDIGAYWSSPALIQYMHEFFDLKEGERCLGFFYMGYYEADIPVSSRTSIDEKIEWLA